MQRRTFRLRGRPRASRLISALVAAAVGVSLAAVVTTPAHAATTHLKASYFVEWTMEGTHGRIGPSQYTDYGKGVITGWPDRIANNSRVAPSTRITYVNPTITKRPSLVRGPDGMIHPDNWWNPTTWDWGHILSSIWSYVKKCAAGAVGATLPSMGGTTAVNLLFFKGAKLYVGPYGYAAIAVGGCLGKIMG